MDLLFLLTCFSSICFFNFGVCSFTSKFIEAEFIRYGLPNFRKLIGVLQIVGATGLLLGYYFSPALLLIASSGLFLLMLSGLIVRIKIKDNFLKSSPAFTFAALNLFIALKTFTKFFY